MFDGLLESIFLSCKDCIKIFVKCNNYSVLIYYSSVLAYDEKDC